MSSSLLPHGLFHAGVLCPPLSPGVCSNSCPLSRWCHLTISYSVTHLLLLPSIFPSIRVFSNELAPCIKCPKYWSFSFNIYTYICIFIYIYVYIHQNPQNQESWWCKSQSYSINKWSRKKKQIPSSSTVCFTPAFDGLHDAHPCWGGNLLYWVHPFKG